MPTPLCSKPSYPYSLADPMLLTVKSLDDSYVMLKGIGKGSFGHVSLARVRSKAAAENDALRVNSMVAIKTMKKKLASISDYNFLREVEFIREVRPHQFLVNVHDMFVDSVNHHFHMSMEIMEMNLYHLMKTQEKIPFEAHEVRSILYQVIAGIDHIHQHRFFHRDIKPENILVSRRVLNQNENSSTLSSMFRSQFKIKIADFGLSRHVDDTDPYTAYVSTRWYRAPEILLRCEFYSAPVDIWAFGAMAAEVANLRPLFPGSNELNQFNLQVMLLGTPGQESIGGSWPKAAELCSKLKITLSPYLAKEDNAILTHPQHRSLTGVVLMCLTWDPKKRCTARDILSHSYFTPESTAEVTRTLKRSPLRIPHKEVVQRGNRDSLDWQSEASGVQRMPSLRSSFKQNQEVLSKDIRPRRVIPTQALQAAVVATSKENLRNGNSVSNSSLKKFGHWSGIFKRDSDEAEMGRTASDKENIPQSELKQVSAADIRYVPKIPLPQLPPLQSFTDTIEKLSIDDVSSSSMIAAEHRNDPPTSSNGSNWSQSNHSHVESVSDKGSTQATTIEVHIGHRLLPETPSSSSSSTSELLPLTVPKNPHRLTHANDTVMHPISIVASNVMNLGHITPDSNYEVEHQDTVSDSEQPTSIVDDLDSDKQLTTYERSVRDSVLLMGLQLTLDSSDSSSSFDDESSSRVIGTESHLVDKFGGSSAIRTDTNSLLFPDIGKSPSRVEPLQSFSFSPYSHSPSKSFRDVQ